MEILQHAERIDSPRRPFQETQRMYQDAKAKGIIDSLLRCQDPYDRARLTEGLTILDLYFNTDSTLEDAAKYVGSQARALKEYARNARNRTVTDILNHAPEEFRAQYPLESLTLTKPLTDASRLRRAEARGVRLSLIRDSVAHGATAVGLGIEFGLDSTTLGVRRRALKKVNVEVPHINRGYDVKKQIADRISQGPFASDSEAQVYLDMVVRSVFESSRGKEGMFASVHEIVIEAGFAYNNRAASLYGEIVSSIVPMGSVSTPYTDKDGSAKTQVNRFVFRQHLKRAIKAFAKNPRAQNLKRNK